MNPHRLEDLAPAWMPTEKSSGRWRTGVKFRCPLCPDHYLVFWFANPEDKGEPTEKKSLFWRVGGAYHDMTLSPQGAAPGEPACFDRADHGRVWVVDGDVYIAPAEPRPDTRVAVPPAQCDA